MKNLQLTTYLTRLRTKQRSNLSAQLLSIIVEVLLCAKREEKETKCLDWKGRNKIVFLFTDTVFVHPEIPMNQQQQKP